MMKKNQLLQKARQLKKIDAECIGGEMNVKELAKLLKEKKYDEFCNSCMEISPRAIHYIFNHIEKTYGHEFSMRFQDELYEHVSSEQFKKWRHALSGEAEMEYIEKYDLDRLGYFYVLTEEEKKQACLI